MIQEPRLRSHVLMSRSATAASRGAFLAINGLQAADHPADQLIGLAAAFKYMSAACGYTPTQVIGLVERMEDDCRFREENTLSAVEQYVTHEVAVKLQ